MNSKTLFDVDMLLKELKLKTKNPILATAQQP
jgi:hypothetical protein